MPCGGGNCNSCPAVANPCGGSGCGVSCLGGPPVASLNYGPSCCGPCSLGVPSVPVGCNLRNWNPVSYYVNAIPVSTPFGIGSPCCGPTQCPYAVSAWSACCTKPYA